MRTTILPAALLASTLAGGIALSACAGTHAREGLVAIMATTWPAIRADALRAPGIAPDDTTSAAITAFGEAMDSRETARIAGADWLTVRVAALGGIGARVAAKEISVGVSRSLIERVDRFHEAWGRLGR